MTEYVDVTKLHAWREDYRENLEKACNIISDRFVNISSCVSYEELWGSRCQIEWENLVNYKCSQLGDGYSDPLTILRFWINLASKQELDCLLRVLCTQVTIYCVPVIRSVRFSVSFLLNDEAFSFIVYLYLLPAAAVKQLHTFIRSSRRVNRWAFVFILIFSISYPIAFRWTVRSRTQSTRLNCR